MRAIWAYWAVSAALALPAPASAQSSGGTIALTVHAGRPIDVLLDQRVVIRQVGQPVTGTLVQPLYAYDREVVPAGTKVLGHVAGLEPLPKAARIRALLSGNLTPPRRVVLQFDGLVLASGRTIPIESVVKREIPRATRASAPPSSGDPPGDSPTGRVRRETIGRAKTAIADARARARDVLEEWRRPGKAERLKDALIERLPYHPQVISAGTAYHAELLAPLSFGTVTASVPASANLRPKASGVLHARLLTNLDSSKTPRGTPVKAIVTEPVFSEDQQLIVPEGTVLDGEVTFTRAARWLHRNGQLRFLFETIRLRAAEPAPLLASLETVETSEDNHLTIDEEGGATLSNPKSRFVAPALAMLALRGGLDRHDHLDPDGDGHILHSGHPGALATGGFFGVGVVGAVVSPLWRPVGIGLSVVGAARTLYSNVFARGREVQFAADTPLDLQLAPGAAAAP